MIFRIFTFLLMALALNAQEAISIPKGPVSLDTRGHTWFIRENTQNSDAKSVLYSQDLILATRLNLGMKEGPFWTRVVLHNITEERKRLFLYNPHAGANTVDTYVYKNGTLQAHHLLGDLHPQKEREILHRFSLFSLELDPGEEVTIITKIENYGLYRIGWEIRDTITFLNQEKNADFLLAFPGGFIFFFLIYALLLYRIYRSPGYILLGAEALSVMLYIYAVYGMFYRLDIGLPLALITTFAWIGSQLALLFRTLFPYYFFEMKGNYPKLSFFIWCLSAIFGLFILATLYAQYVSPHLFAYFGITFLLFLFNPIITMLLAIYMWRKKEPGSFYFLIGQGLITLFATLHTLSVFGYLPYSWVYQHMVPLALIADSIFMLILQYLRTRKEYQKNLREKELLMEQSRFFSIGQAIGNITHQWKSPLTKLGTSLTMLESLLRMDQSRLIKQMESELPSMQFAVTHMRTTMDEFNRFYATQSDKKYFSPKQTLQEGILPLLQSKIMLKNVEIDLQMDDALQIESFEHIFSNIMMVLIDNSLDAFDSSPENQNRITISFIQGKEPICIHYCDNAGGIKIEPIERVFDYFASTKEDKAGHGIGLAMVKILVNERLKGTITAKNTNDGACFTICFP